MGSHPHNLALRFILEITALICIGIWGWNKSDGILKYVLAIGLPVLFAAIWGIFAVPGDPSRSGQTVIVTPGVIRLVIELGIFAAATWALYDQGNQKFSYVFGAVVIIHYIISYDRVGWLYEH